MATDVGSRASAFEYTACPANCGHFLLDSDPSYAPKGESRLGEFFDIKQGVAIRLGRCPCGALQCIRCKGLVPQKDVFSHVCAIATKDDDPASKALIAKIGKACPACGMFIEKNQGCSHMMCGDRASGTYQQALKMAVAVTNSTGRQCGRSATDAQVSHSMTARSNSGNGNDTLYRSGSVIHWILILARDTVQHRLRNKTSSNGWQLLPVLLICAPQTSALSAAHAFQRRQEMVCKWMSTRPSYSSSVLRSYVMRTWHAGKPFGVGCAGLERFGNQGDGGKALCEPDQLLVADPERWIVSIGVNADVSFEMARFMREVGMYILCHRCV